MVTSPLLNGALIRSRPLCNRSLIFCRYKSITAAIERGRQEGPDRFRSRVPRPSRGEFGSRLDNARRGDRFGRESEDGLRASRRPEIRDHPFRSERATPQDYSGRRPSRFGDQSSQDHSGRRPSRFEERTSRDFSGRGSSRFEGRPSRDFQGGRSPRSEAQLDRSAFGGRSRFSRDKEGFRASSTRPSRSHDDDSAGSRGEQGQRASKIRGPDVLPYSTAASEFIYGYSSVLAALKANRRKLYKLYLHSRGDRDGLMAHLRAHKLFPILEEVGDEYLVAMDRASNGRPHNGVILESSPLPVPPITELRNVFVDEETFNIALDSQSAEDVAVNGKQDSYKFKSGGWRQPLVLYVDGVLDEGNLGAIARSAYFLGVDAIVTPTRQSAPWSHIAIKASAGAAEAVNIFKVASATDFLSKSSKNGWKVYASDAVPPESSTSSSRTDGQDIASSKVVYAMTEGSQRLPADHSPVSEHPTILMLGAEGTGLRRSLVNQAHYKVGLPHGRHQDDVGVDSLNVSVAASLLCYEMLQKPVSRWKGNQEEALF